MTTPENELKRSQSPSYDLTGKRVVVVGGKTGIGLGIAQATHAAGASVTVASRRSASVADHPELAPFQQIELDISDEEAVRSTFGAMDSLDHLLVAAGPTDGSWGTFMDEDMAGAAIYLASRAGDYVVGTTLAVDGGIVYANPGIAGAGWD